MITGGHIALQIAAGLVAAVVAGGAPTTASDPGATPAMIYRKAIERALTVPGARLEGAVEERAGSRPSDCRALEAEVGQPVEASGRVAVKLSGRSGRGQRCEAWTWMRVRVVAPVAVAARALRAGERLEGAVTTEERELRAGHAPAAIGSASVAARDLTAGQLLDAAAVGEPTLRPGEAVKVLVVNGALVIEQSGRAVPCVRGRACAVLISGKQVEGSLIDGRLVVQTP
jgi:hypothetical protein